MRVSSRGAGGEQRETIEFVPKPELDRAQQENEKLRPEMDRLKQENERLRRELEAALRRRQTPGGAPFARRTSS